MTQKVTRAGEPQERKEKADEQDEPIQIVDKRRFTRLTEEDEPGAAVNESEAARYPSYVEELQSRLKQAEEQVEKVQARYKGAQAELARETEELRTRLQRSAEARLEMAKGEIFLRLLEVADNLERAILSAEAGADSSMLLAGVKATHALLLRQLEAEGVKQISALGEPFDPTVHEAVDTVEVEPEFEGRVVEVYKTGYKFGERLLRPTAVRVGRSSSDK